MEAEVAEAVVTIELMATELAEGAAAKADVEAELAEAVEVVAEVHQVALPTKGSTAQKFHKTVSCVAFIVDVFLPRIGSGDIKAYVVTLKMPDQKLQTALRRKKNARSSTRRLNDVERATLSSVPKRTRKNKSKI